MDRLLFFQGFYLLFLDAAVQPFDSHLFHGFTELGRLRAPKRVSYSDAPYLLGRDIVGHEVLGEL